MVDNQVFKSKASDDLLTISVEKLILLLIIWLSCDYCEHLVVVSRMHKSCYPFGHHHEIGYLISLPVHKLARLMY